MITATNFYIISFLHKIVRNGRVWKSPPNPVSHLPFQHKIGMLASPHPILIFFKQRLNSLLARPSIPSFDKNTIKDRVVIVQRPYSLNCSNPNQLLSSIIPLKLSSSHNDTTVNSDKLASNHTTRCRCKE